MTASSLTSVCYIRKHQQEHPVIDFLRGRNYQKVSQLCFPYSQDKITDEDSSMDFLDDLEENKVQGLDIWDTSNAETIAWVKNVISFAIFTGNENDLFSFYSSREDAMKAVEQTNKECRDYGFPTDDYFITTHAGV